MATKVQGLNKVGEYWHYSLRANGQRIHGSTRARDLATAKLVLEEKRKELLKGQMRIVCRIPTLKELVMEWTQVHRQVHSPGHLLNVDSHSRHWLLPDLGTTRIDRVTTTDVLEVRNRVLEAGRSPTTANNLLRIIYLLFGYALKVNYLERLPFKVKFLRVQRKPRPVLAANVVQAFLASVDKHTRNPHVPVMIRVMVGLGMRESEVLGMRWEWFDAEQRTYVVGKAKGKEARVLPVPDWLWKAIQSLPKTLSEWVFPAGDGKPHRPNYCRNVIDTVAEELKLGNLTQHRLRATFASLHAEAGTPVTEIQGMLGHKSVQTTMIYVETSLDAKRKAQDALSEKLRLA
jgi:integrase/recombinase XerC